MQIKNQKTNENDENDDENEKMLRMMEKSSIFIIVRSILVAP